MRGSTSLAVALALGLALSLGASACRQTVVLDSGDGGGGSTGLGGGFGGFGGGFGGFGGTSDGGPPPGFCAGGQTKTVGGSSETPDVIVALDRSSSMNTPFSGSLSRLDAALAALFDVVQRYQGSVRFGYVGFPAPAATSCSNGMTCCADSDLMYPTTMGYDAFRYATTCSDPTSAQCATTADRPTDAALHSCRNTYNMFDTQSHNRFVLLVTDGDPMCSSRSQCNNALSEVAMLSGSPTQAETVVIGIGDAGSSCQQQLALSGGHGSPSYYHVSTPSDLPNAISAAVNDLAQTACTIDIFQPLSNPDRLGVSLNGVTVPRGDGWDYLGQDKGTIRLAGYWCDYFLGSDAGSLRLQSCSMGPP